MKKIFATVMLFITALCFSGRASATLELEITGGQDIGYPIAVSDFAAAANPQLARDLAAVVRNELMFSGKFSPLAPGRMPQQAADKSQLKAELWRDLVNSVAVGKLEEAGDKYRLTYQLVEVAGGEVLVSKAITFSRNQLRTAAHTVSNQIYEAIIHERGAFLTKISYVSVKHGQQYPYQLVVADYDGYNEQVILRSREPVMSPSWDPKDSRIAYVSFESKHPAIYIQNYRTKQRIKVAQFNGINGNPVFSPDGTRLAMVLSKDGNPEIYVLDIASKTLKRITNNRVIDTEPSWDPSGNFIYFSSERGGRPQIYRVDVNNPSSVARVTWDNISNLDPAVAPDGRSIAFITRIDNSYRVARQELDTKYMMVLTNNKFDESPCFAPNGSMIIYATMVRGKKSLALVSSDGRFQANLPSTSGAISAPSWSPFFN